MSELEKNYLVVKLPGVTQAIYRGGKVDVLIKRQLSGEADAVAPDSNFEQPVTSIKGSGEVIDLYLTGPYIVKDIVYEFNGSPEASEFKYSTELILVRREWLEISDDNKLDSEKNI